MRRAPALAALLLALAASAGGGAIAQDRDRFDRGFDRDDAPPPGNYLRTCRNITVFNYGPAATISAQCRDETGRWRDTSARFAGCDRVVNRDGQLYCRGPGERDDFRPPAGGGGGGFRPPPYGGSQITLFSAPNFGGERFQTTSEITNLPKRYNDQAMSLRIEGRGAWQVCVDSDFQGRCQVFDHDVADLRQFGLGYAISSLRPAR
jgi:hypothetical protein